MLAAALFVAGLVAIVVAIAMLAGLWWGVLAGGVLLVALAVLTNAATPGKAEPGGDAR
ncbi:hypothetical protein GXB85_04660 [Cellulomonas sp. APG4]|uniref:hypothetical protein n=1 Tax=Cellulomonas sp. APG4 TaxID=1538656 RepID=UPI00137AE3B9|nr:hypothetical protein [Cellulomonas sp. APG4]NCT90245.1 hypothetical protein [Cellulomonas sp. APG4]